MSNDLPQTIVTNGTNGLPESKITLANDNNSPYYSENALKNNIVSSWPRFRFLVILIRYPYYIFRKHDPLELGTENKIGKHEY